MAALDAWTWMLRICVCFNVIYSLIEIYWVSHSRDFWKQTGPKIASLVIGGFFTAVFLANGIVRFFQLRRSALASCEKLSFRIEAFASFVGIVIYIIRATLVDVHEEAANAVLMLGCAGHVFSMIGTFVRSSGSC